MKYIVIDERKDGMGDVWSSEFDDREKAINEARNQWEHLAKQEREERTVYVLESADACEESEHHFDGNVVWEAKERG